MADVYMNNPGVQSDLDNMVQAANTMEKAVEDFVDLVNANLSSFTGITSDAATTLLQKLITEAHGMNDQFGKGTQTLQNMVDIINSGDRQAGAQIHA